MHLTDHLAQMHSGALNVFGTTPNASRGRPTVCQRFEMHFWGVTRTYDHNPTMATDPFPTSFAAAEPKNSNRKKLWPGVVTRPRASLF
jgi:hypothetical protein